MLAETGPFRPTRNPHKSPSAQILSEKTRSLHLAFMLYVIEFHGAGLIAVSGLPESRAV
jgi:hypothetical protein